MPPNKRMQPTHQPVIKFTSANLSPVWWAADAWRSAAVVGTRSSPPGEACSKVVMQH
jgi:hypothetical protein